MCTQKIFEVRDAGFTNTTGAYLREYNEVAPAMRMIESSRCPATGIGFKSVNTVIPPRIP